MSEVASVRVLHVHVVYSCNKGCLFLRMTVLLSGLNLGMELNTANLASVSHCLNALKRCLGKCDSATTSLRLGTQLMMQCTNCLAV